MYYCPTDFRPFILGSIILQKFRRYSNIYLQKELDMKTWNKIYGEFMRG